MGLIQAEGPVRLVGAWVIIVANRPSCDLMIPLIFDPIYSQLELPPNHRFPIRKYQALYDRLVEAGVGESRFIRPGPLKPEQVKTALSPGYIDQFIGGTLDDVAVRKIGFPWSQQLVRRTFTAAGGTVLAGILALEHGRALNLTGGYHHAFYDHGSGFCIVNDLYLCALNLLTRPGVSSVLIFDCDVHQGDGTASLAAGRGDVVTVSIHGEKNFPFHKQISDVDVALPSGVADDEYLACVHSTLSEVLSRFKPDVVIYDAGADVHIDDELGHFHITTAGVAARDELVFDKCDRAGLPVCAVIGGGYQRNIPALVDVHFQLFRAALGLP